MDELCNIKRQELIKNKPNLIIIEPILIKFQQTDTARPFNKKSRPSVSSSSDSKHRKDKSK